MEQISLAHTASVFEPVRTTVSSPNAYLLKFYSPFIELTSYIYHVHALDWDSFLKTVAVASATEIPREVFEITSYFFALMWIFLDLFLNI